MTLGQSIKAWRGVRGLTQVGLCDAAERAGHSFTRTALTMWENDERDNLKRESIDALLAALDITYEELVAGPAPVETTT
ncbi:MAG: hypothetical protein AMXMBFR84_37440 [Candidatus Hydrogenedentota bacterium]